MKISELRGKSVDQLKDLLASLKKEALYLRFQKTTGELSNIARIKQVRKTVAQVKTLLKEKEFLVTGGGNA